jgi:sulfopyruvate decarboxylase subunit beta
MKRFDALQAIARHFKDELVVTNIGGVRHEWQALRSHPGNYHLQNLGLTSSVAFGLALALPHRKVVAFDGDGSLLLNLGALTTIANHKPRNLIHIVFDNECYESSRGAPTATAGLADLAAIAKGAGFANIATTRNVAEFERRSRRRRRSAGVPGRTGKQVPLRTLHRTIGKSKNSCLAVLESLRSRG